MDINKVLFISQEISPYLESSEMADSCRLLAQGVQEKGVEVRTFMPKYGFINERRNQLHEVIRLSGMNLIIDDTDHPLIIKVATLQPSHLQVYFIYNEDYFTQNITKKLEIDSMPHDNDERTIFYVRGVLETVKKLRWIPSVIQCSGWITALAPLYIKKFYSDDPSFRDAKIVLALYNDKLVEPLNDEMAHKLKFDGFKDDEIRPILDKSATYNDLMKLAVENCDAIIQCSPDVSQDILRMAAESQKPFLKFDAAEELPEFVNRIMDFYQSL